MARKKIEKIEVIKEQIKGTYNRRDADGTLYRVCMVDIGEKIEHIEENKLEITE